VFGDLLGKNLNCYRIERQIGAGGMGVVYLAHDEQLERPVAIKSPAPRYPSGRGCPQAISPGSPILGVLYEARLALGKAEMKHGNKEDGRARLAEVERDAGASGFVLIRRKAATTL
jgi:serine/threonine protein kinase